MNKNKLVLAGLTLILGLIPLFTFKLHHFSIIWLSIILLCVLIQLFIKDKSTKNLKEINDYLIKMKNGDFSLDKDKLDQSDETDKILFNLNEVAKTVRELVLNLNNEVKTLYSAGESLGSIASASANIATEVAKTVEGLAINATNQVNDLDICNENVTDTTNTSHRINEQIQNINEIANNFVKIAVQSKQDIEQTLDKINTIEVTSNKTSEQITDLGKTSKEIGQIIDLITNIASQTNLLALNAAIEAARAGDQGKGFAVVADEVKKLATQTTSAADKIKSMIHTVQEEAEEAVLSTKLSLENVQKGASSFDIIKTNFNNIYKQANVINDETKTISETIDYLVKKNDEVLEAMGSISNSTGTQEVKNHSGNILLMARNITVSSSIFKLDNKPEIFYWSKRFFTGISEIDYQHYIIVNYVNEIYREYIGNKDKDKLFSILIELAEFTTSHFGHEQVLMKKHNYPRFDLHLKEHTALLGQVGKYIEDIKNNRAKIDENFLNFLNNWLSHHILEEDMQYAPYLREHGER